MVSIKVENLAKQYRLGYVGSSTLKDDFARFWAKIRGKENPILKIGEENDRSVSGESNYVWALKDINFEVQQGEVLGIIGKNGAGKSTLLKLLSKVTSPTLGEIKVKGKIASLLEVGTGFHPELTGKENIYLNGAILGMKKEEITKKFDEIVEFAGVERYIDTPVKRYSSGMYVRLAFAVAAHLEPDILIVDEVLAVGDADFQKKAIGKMQEVSKGGGRTVLFVSHNMVSVQKLCTKALIMKNGRIDFLGNTDEAISKYLIKESSKINDGVEKFPIEIKNIQINNFNINNSKNFNTNKILLGENCSFEIDLKNNNDKFFHLNLRYQIFDKHNQLITTINTYQQNATSKTYLKKSLFIKMTINKISIAPGDYRIGIEILDLNLKEVLYLNDNFYDLSVIEADFFNSGKLPTQNNIGIFLADCEWDFK